MEVKDYISNRIQDVESEMEEAESEIENYERYLSEARETLATAKKEYELLLKLKDTMIDFEINWEEERKYLKVKKKEN